MSDAPCATYDDVAPDQLLGYLAANLRSRGAQSIGMKAWSAGLTYNCGLSAYSSDGRIHFYADNVPDIPQLMRFIRAEILEAPFDPSQAEASLAQVFWSREAMSFEDRGAAMAADIADGKTPEKVRQFREGVLDLRERRDLAEVLHARLAAECGKVVPGLGVPTASVAGGQYVVIAGETALAGYQTYLKSVEGEGTRVWRLYPRDLWIGGG